METAVQTKGRISVVRPVGELRDDEQMDQLVAQVTDLMASGSAGIVLDMSQASFVSSCGLSALVRIVAQGNIQECGVLLAATTSSLAGMLEVTRLDRFLSVRPTVKDAIAELEASPRAGRRPS